MRKYLLITFAISLVILVVSIKKCQHIKNDRDRLLDNQKTLMSDIEFYQTKDSLNVASVERLVLTNREFSRYCESLKKQVKDLNLKVKRLRSVSQTTTETEYIIKTVIRDSILPGMDTLIRINYHNPYLTVEGDIKQNLFSGRIESRDTLIQFVYRVPRKFLFFRWGTKAVRQEIISRNPYSKIVYSQYIELKK